MCECCMMRRFSKRRTEEGFAEKKPADFRIAEVAAKPGESGEARSVSNEKMLPAIEQTAAECSASSVA